MKVYVDKLPKCCSDCPCCNECMDYGCSCNLNNDYLTYDDYGKKRHKNCHLQSVADYTNQVRKKVCEEIRDIVKKISRPTTEYDDGTFDYDIDAIELDHLLIWLGNGEMDLIKHHLDQIQGESDGK